MTSRDGGNAGNAGAVGSADNTFVYGENNRLKEAGIGGSPLATYTYNGRGERVKKLGTTTTYYYYNQGGKLITELDGSGNTLVEYVYLDGVPLALITSGNVYDIHPDHLGTPQVITNNVQAVVWSGDYRPFGEINITTEAITNNLRFPGQYFDGETGLQYNYFRDYDPTTGRYITSDPTGIQGGLNTYVYANGNPENFTDEYGLFWGINNAYKPEGVFNRLMPATQEFHARDACRTVAIINAINPLPTQLVTHFFKQAGQKIGGDLGNKVGGHIASRGMYVITIIQLIKDLKDCQKLPKCEIVKTK